MDPTVILSLVIGIGITGVIFLIVASGTSSKQGERAGTRSAQPTTAPGAGTGLDPAQSSAVVQNPQPSSPAQGETCWYCSRNKTTGAVHHKMHQILATETTAISHRETRVTYSYAARSVRVPRCAECKQLHAKQKRLLSQSAIWFCVTFVPLGLGLLYHVQFKVPDSSWTPEESLGLLLAILAPIVAGVVFGIRAATLPGRHGMRAEDHVNDHPEVNGLIMEGWRRGEKPGSDTRLDLTKTHGRA